MSGGNMEKVLRMMADKNASDVFLSANMPILIKIHGQMLQLSDQSLTPGQPRQLLAELLSPQQLEELDDTGELNLGLAMEGLGSFRLSAFRQRGSTAAVIRHIPHLIPSLDSLNLPPLLSQLVLEKRGLILMVGATGTGKSTTLAAMLEERNKQVAGHILTIEDPIEFMFSNKRSLINQREVGRDTETLQTALRNALRQAPDCILIGEIRDRPTMSMALAYAQTGHLCLATLHANNSYHAMNRIINFYPLETRPSLLLDLAAALQAVISLRLVRTKSGARVPAVEILLNTRNISELIEKGEISQIKEALEKSLAPGSQTFEQALFKLFMDGRITQEEALTNADSASNMLWLINQATAGDMSLSGAAKPPARPAEERKEGAPAGGAGPTFNDFKIDVNA